MEDKELFESAVADEPVEVPVEQPAEPEKEAEQARDEHGRFAAEQKAEQAEQVIPAEQPAEQPQNEAHVPSWRLREVNEAREAAERRAQQLETQSLELQRQFQELQRQIAAQNQQPQQPQEFDWENPAGFVQKNIDPVRQQFETALQAQKQQFSEMLARQTAGDAKVDEVKQWAMSRMNDPALEARVARSNHPWGELIKAHQEYVTLSEIGNDPNAYVQKKLEEALKDQAFLAKAVEAAKAQAQPTQPNNIVQLPPSINRATSTAGLHEEAGDMSDKSLFAFATK